MSGEVDAKAAKLAERNEPFALATVVAVDRPVSARPGDRAVITRDGTLSGWIGGSCSQPIVLREALAALADGGSRLVRIRPPGRSGEPDRPGVVTEVTTCASEGGVDIFVEPRLPRSRLVVAGSSPAARALPRLARVVDYRIVAALDDPSENVPGAGEVVSLGGVESLKLGRLDAVVVATMNRYDERALEAALASDAGYVGLVASRARGKSVLDLLRARGADESSVARVVVPAGLDLGPSSQEEIALAVLAEVVAKRHEIVVAPPVSLCGEPREDGNVRTQAQDPVCGMTVAITTSTPSAQVRAERFYFCSSHCKDAFLEARALGRSRSAEH